MLGATIYNANTSYIGTISNHYGFYSLTLSASKVTLAASFVGYKTFRVEFQLNKDTLINIKLEAGTELTEVKIVGEKEVSKVQNTQMSVNSIPIKTIRNIPAIFGEVDVLKSIQLLPGVKMGMEGSSGFYVRGGGPDQNLILLDGVPVYNVNHLFGFFSVFNADALNDVTLIKGGFPAQYGGRLSSVLDIRMKEGNDKKIKGEGSIGIISSKVTIDGPAFKGNTTFIVSARRTYADLLLMPVMAKVNASDPNSKSTFGYFFWDINAKINHKFSDKSHLFYSIYAGRDKMYASSEYTDSNSDSKGDFALKWGNVTAALRWNYMFSNKLFSNTTVTYSTYQYITAVNGEENPKNTTNPTSFGLAYNSGIEDVAAKIDFDYIPNPEHYIKFGISNIYHTFQPGINTLKIQGGIGIDTTLGNKKVYAYEQDAYVEDNYTITKSLKANIGLHYSSFLVRKTFYYSFQPRISARYLISDNWSVKAAYSQMTQYIHLLSNSNISLPTDLWLPVTNNIVPQKSVQYAVGSVYAISDQYDLSMEGYYKTMSNMIDYKEGANFFSTNDDWEQKIETGKGWSYGVELMLQKKLGNTTGWIGYTLSWAMRQFDNLNFGNAYPDKYDRRHDISIVINHRFSDTWDVGVTWVYGTGNSISLPVERYASLFNNSNYFGNEIQYYDKRNGFRVPAYHRMDIGFNRHKQTARGETTWSFGAYNAYNKKNPFFLQFSYDNNSQKVLKQYSILPLIPYISYSFKF